MTIDWQAIHDELPDQEGPEAEARREVSVHIEEGLIQKRRIRSSLLGHRFDSIPCRTTDLG